MIFSYQRFVSRLVLLSFFFQTLWPSVVFAATEVEVLRPSSPLGFRIGSTGRSDSPQLSLEVFSDEEDDEERGSTSPRSLFQKTFQPSDAAAALMPLLETMAIFGQLQVKAEGIEWFAQGLWMTINWQGELLVRGDERATAVTQPIILQNPNKIYLGERIALNHLKVISPLVVNLGKDSRIDFLEAVGLPSSLTGAEIDPTAQKQPSVFQNASGTSLTVKQAVLQGIHWQNQGHLNLQGELYAGGAPVENTGTWHFEEEAKLTNAISVLNTGSMAGSGNWHLDDVGLVVNGGTLGNETDTLHLKASFLRNSHQIKPAQLVGVLSKGGENHGQIATTVRTDLTCLGDWRNGAKGVMHSQGQQTMWVLRDLVNEGRITSSTQKVTVKGVTFNTGLIEGDVSGLTFAHLINDGVLGSANALTLSVQSGKNTGEIASRGRMALTVLGGSVFENEGKITAQDSLDLALQGKLINRKIMTSKTTLETTGEGILDNHGTFQGNQKTTIGHAETDNHGLMVEKGAVHLKPTKRFHNHLTGTVIAKGELTVSGTADIINEAGTDDTPGFGGQDIVFEDYKGTFKNQGGRLTAERRIKGAVATLVNQGLIQAGVGYDLTIRHFMNIGVWQGAGRVTVGEGRNLGRIDGVGLQVTVQQELVNEESASMIVQSVDGSGIFRNRNLLKGQGTKVQPMAISVHTFENHKTFEPGEAVTFTASVQKWLNGEQGVIDVDTIGFAKADTASSQTLNQGVLKAKQLSLERSLENEGSLTTTHLTAKASSLINHQNSTLTVLGRSTVALEEFINEGRAVFHQAVSGSIIRLINKTSIEPFDSAKTEDTRDRLEFKALNTLRGTTLTNTGLLLALQDLGWQGVDVENTGVLVTRSAALGFSHQLVNRGLWRWAEGDLDAKGRHVLNLNTFEKTTKLEAPYQALTLETSPKDQTTVFQAGRFENRGQWLGAAQKIIAEKIINTGRVSLTALDFDVDHFINRGTFQITTGNVTGRVGALENAAIFLLLAGRFDVAGTTFVNSGQIKSALGWSYAGVSFENSGQLLTADQMRLRLSAGAKNTGTLQADGGFDWHIKTFDHQQGKMIGHVKKQKSTLVVTDKMTTGKDTDCQLHGLDLTTREWDHCGILSLSAASSLKPGTFKHKGVVATVENIYALLTLVTDNLQLQGVMAFYDMDIRAGRATSMSEGKLIAINKLGFKVDGDYNHYGVFQARELTYQGRYNFSDFINYGRVISTSQAFIRGYFQNTSRGNADLTGATFDTVNWRAKSLVNEGILRLANLQSLGEGTRGRAAEEGEAGLVEIINRKGATLILEDCGYSYGVSEDKKGRELKYGGFAFGKVTNNGTIAFGRGTYHIRGNFENNGVHQVLRGQDLWYWDLINHGEIDCQQGNYHIDHTRGKVTKVGKVRVKGELLFQLSDQEDAGEVIANNDIASENKVRVEAKDFTAPQDMNLPGTWEFNVTNFICPYHVKAPHLKIWAAYLETGNASKFGYIESANGVLDIWVRKLKNTHGKLWGEKGAKVIVEDDDLENGAAILIPDPENTGVIYGSNGSTIASNGPLDIDVRRGNFHNIYGQVYSRQPFDIKVKQRFRVKAGHIRSGTSGKIKAGVLEVTRENPGAAQIVTNSYYRHYSRGGWLNHEEGDELIQEYGMRYWEQSHEGIIDITKETPGASGNLDLDCPEVFVTASSLLASGLIWSDHHKTYIFANQTLPTGFHVHDRNGHAGKLAALDGVYAKAGSMTITGSGSGKFVHMSATDFLLECLNIQRRDNLPKMFLTFDLVKLIEAQATAQGFIQDRGYTRKGKPRFGFGVPITQVAAEDKDSLIFLDKKPQNTSQTEYAMETGLIKMLTRTLMSHAMGLEGLRDDILKRFQGNARKTGKEVISQKELEQQLEAMIVWKLQEVYHDLYEIARRRGEVIDPKDEVQTELRPILGVPPAVQDYRAEGGGALIDDRNAGEGVKVEADRDARFKSAYVEGDTFDINGRRMFEAETTKYVVINRCGDTVTTREIFMPQATFIGRTKGSAVGGEHYHAVGADFATGAEGGHYECEHGDKVDEPAVATTKVERTERKKGKKVCGVQISGDRTTTHTTTSQQLLQTRYRSLGKLEHHVPEGTHTRTGVVNEAEGELLYHAKHHEGDAAAAVNTQSVATEKTTFLGGSSHSHYQESAAFAPNISRSATRVRFEGDTADLKGEVLQTPEVAEKVKKTFKLGMSKRELAHRSSSSRERVLGAASVDTQGGQDAGLQSAVMGIEGGKVKWFSDTGDSLIFESVIADQIGKMVVKKDFKQETATLNAWQQTTRESSGFSAPILEGKVQDPLVSSVQGLRQSEHAADQAAGMLKAGSDGLKAGMDGFKILQSLKAYNPLDALKTLLGRWTTISLSVNTSESSQRQSVAQPNVLNFEVLVLDNTHSHLEGKISGKTLVALCDKLTTGPMVSTAESHHEERGGGVSANLMTLVSGLPSLNVHETSGHTEQRTHNPTTINVDQLFVRVNHAVFSGTQIRAKLVDAIIKGSLTIESVLDTFRSTHSGLDLSTTGDVRIADQEKVKEKINAIANLVGTQQFYLQVGQTLLTRSAEYGLRPDGNVVDVEKVKTVDGREFYLRPIPEEVDEEDEGSLAIALGLSKEEMVPYHQGLEVLSQQGRKPKGKREKKEVRFADAEAAAGAIKGKPQTWLSQAAGFTIDKFLQGIADKKGVRITVWQKQNHEGNVEHLLTVGTEDTDSHKIPEVHLYRTGDHYDLLEADPTRVEAASYQTEQLQERDEEDGFVINMPIGTALTLAAQLNELQQLRAQTYQEMEEQGVPEEDRLELLHQLEQLAAEDSAEERTTGTSAVDRGAPGIDGKAEVPEGRAEDRFESKRPASLVLDHLDRSSAAVDDAAGFIDAASGLAASKPLSPRTQYVHEQLHRMELSNGGSVSPRRRESAIEFYRDKFTEQRERYQHAQDVTTGLGVMATGGVGLAAGAALTAGFAGVQAIGENGAGASHSTASIVRYMVAEGATAYVGGKIGAKLTSAVLAKLKPLAQRTFGQAMAKVRGGQAQALNKAPYDPRAMDGLLKGRYGNQSVSSSTLPGTSMPNVKLAGQELCLLTPRGKGFKVVFDTKGFPILDPHAVFDTKIAADIALKGNRSFDFKTATANLKESISRGSINPNIFNVEQLAAITKNAERIPGYTWHHHQDFGRLQLIPSKIHNHPLMRHVGGFSLSQ